MEFCNFKEHSQEFIVTLLLECSRFSHGRTGSPKGWVACSGLFNSRRASGSIRALRGWLPGSSHPSTDFKCPHPNKACLFPITFLSYSQTSLWVVFKTRYFCLYAICEYISRYTYGNYIHHNTQMHVAIKCLSRSRLRNDFLQAICGFRVLSSFSSPFLHFSSPTFVS